MKLRADDIVCQSCADSGAVMVSAAMRPRPAARLLTDVITEDIHVCDRRLAERASACARYQDRTEADGKHRPREHRTQENEETPDEAEERTGHLDHTRSNEQREHEPEAIQQEVVRVAALEPFAAIEAALCQALTRSMRNRQVSQAE